MDKRIKLLAMLLVSVSGVTVFSCNSYATIYYDIDFSSPEHTVGSPPTVGPSITTPSRIVFGNPIVSRSLGALQDQPLVFNSLGSSPSFYYDQIKLDMDRGNGFYYTAFDVLTQNLVGSRNQFTILFDTPRVQNITFRNFGVVDLFSQTTFAYQDDQVLHFEVLMNISKRQTSVYVNDAERYSGGFNPDSYLRSIRFSHGLKSGIDNPDYSSYVGLDNIFVADYIIPEPTALSLFAIGSVVLGRRRRVKIEKTEL